MKEYLDYARSSGKYESKFIKVDGDALDISVKLQFRITLLMIFQLVQ